MHRILYISTAREPFTPEDMRDLLRVARLKNAARDVTGLLVAGGRRFLQVLEGEHDAVLATYDRIALDPRHFAIVKLHDKPIEDRSFAQWSMGFEQGGSAEEGSTLEDQVSAIIAPIADASLKAYFADFARRHSPA